MKVISLFDGMSCAQIALSKLNIDVTSYIASEIDKHAIAVTQANFPDTQQVGPVESIRNLHCDILIGGSPCQGFSNAGKNLGFADTRSNLLLEYVRVLEESQPKYFLLENVPMRTENKDHISSLLGVKPRLINSSLVSAQNRQRLYWTNIPVVNELRDKKIVLKDIMDLTIPFTKSGITPVDKHNSKLQLICVGGLLKSRLWKDDGKLLQSNFSQSERVYSYEGKSPTLSAHSGGTAGVGNALVTDNVEPLRYRKLTITEVEKLQTVPVGYTKAASLAQRHKMLGNGFTVDVIAHILRGMQVT
jgi:DNA-cytosine methyltransferase